MGKHPILALFSSEIIFDNGLLRLRKIFTNGVHDGLLPCCWGWSDGIEVLLNLSEIDAEHLLKSH